MSSTHHLHKSVASLIRCDEGVVKVLLKVSRELSGSEPVIYDVAADIVRGRRVK